MQQEALGVTQALVGQNSGTGMSISAGIHRYSFVYHYRLEGNGKIRHDMVCKVVQLAIQKVERLSCSMTVYFPLFSFQAS